MMMWLTLLRSPSARAEEVHRQEMASHMISPTLRTVACLMVEASLSSPGCPRTWRPRGLALGENAARIHACEAILSSGDGQAKKEGQLQHFPGELLANGGARSPAGRTCSADTT